MSVRALFFDVFGTLVDWRSSIAREAEAILKPLGHSLDWLGFADAWQRIAKDLRLALFQVPFVERELASIDDDRVTISQIGLPYARTIAALFDPYRQQSARRFSSAV